MNVLDKVRHFAKSLCLLLLLLASIPVAQAQDPTTVTGRVTDEKGELMVGTTVIEVGAENNAAITDFNGQYTLRLTTENPTLLFEFLGYKNKEVKVGSQRVLDVILEEDVAAIDELVVVGYGTQRKVSVVGAQSSVKSDQIKMPTGNLSNAIAGRVSGIVAVTRSGEPGHDNSDIWIRGMSTLSGQSSSPLILVDGVERSLNNIDPEDVESLNVLKDASATAVYGVRGANGVIIITTKPGKVGTPQFNVDYYESFTRMTQRVRMADAYTYMDVANEAFRNSNPGKNAPYSQEYIVATKKANGDLYNDNPRFYNEYLYPNVNWLKEIFNDWGHNRRANVSVRGGVPNASYYVSLSYYNEEGQTKNFELENYNTKMNYDRFNFTSNLNLRPTSRTRIDLGFTGYIAQGHYPQQSAQDLYNSALEINPVYLPKTMPDGTLSGTQEMGNLRNPFMDLSYRGYYEEFTNTINTNIRATQDLDWWDWSKGLSISAMVSFDAYSYRKNIYERWSQMFYFDALKDEETGLWIEDTVYDENGNYRIKNINERTDELSYKNDTNDHFRSKNTSYVEASLNYDRVFGRHRVSALALFNQRVYRQSWKDSDQITDLVGSLPYKSRSFAARGTYSFDDRYLFEVNVGINGSENFSPDNRWGTFPAFGAGWVISNEDFWGDLRNVVSFFKIRYTLGWVGSDTTTERRFMYQGIMASGGGIYGLRQGTSYGLTTGWSISKYGVNVGWSKSRKQDLGIDINFMNDKLSLSVDLFKEYRNNIFLKRKMLPGYAGFVEEPWANLGAVENKGIEVQLEYSARLSRNVHLTVRGNGTFNKDKILEDDTPAAAYPWMETRGTNVNANWGYVAEGLFTSQEEIDSHATQFGTVYVGDIKYKDLNGDGRIDEDDKTVIGRGDVPQIYYGFGFDLQIHRFSIAALFQGTGRVDRIIGKDDNTNGIIPFSSNNGLDNVYHNIGDRWSADDPTNTNVFYPRLTYNSEAAINNSVNSSWWLKDMSFLRLKQLNISYQLPQKWMDKCFLNDASVYLMGTNLFTFSKWKLWDPELNTSNGNRYPNTTSYSIGVRFSF